jgi:hypothetical protein
VIGPTQLELLRKAGESSGGTVLLTHERAGNKQRMAARRLVERGLLAGPALMGGGKGTYRETRGRDLYLYIYTLTERGRDCWLKVKR